MHHITAFNKSADFLKSPPAYLSMIQLLQAVALSLSLTTTLLANDPALRHLCCCGTPRLCSSAGTFLAFLKFLPFEHAFSVESLWLILHDGTFGVKRGSLSTKGYMIHRKLFKVTGDSDIISCLLHLSVWKWHSSMVERWLCNCKILGW